MNFKIRKAYWVKWVDSGQSEGKAIAPGVPGWQFDEGVPAGNERESNLPEINTIGYLRKETEHAIEMVFTCSDEWDKTGQGYITGRIEIPKVSIVESMELCGVRN